MTIPAVTAIIERERNGEIEVLVQTRWKPKLDPDYSGTLEFPAGTIEAFENVFDTLKREIEEETGLILKRIKSDIHTSTYNIKDDGAFAFKPFCCQQQLKNGKPWIGFAFLCEVEDSEPKLESNETKNIHWIKKSDLRSLFQSNPEKIFTLQLGVIDFYLNQSE
jgi:8-oxo-dGTP pyrophosphatase MutT (NUDIX family)